MRADEIERRRAYDRKRWKENPDRRLKHRRVARKWYEKNIELAKQRAAKWKKDNRERARENANRWYAKNREYLCEYNRQRLAKKPKKPKRKTIRQQAIDRGLKHYFTGKPCVHGHVCERFVSSSGCKKCGQESRWKIENRDLVIKSRRENYKKNRQREIKRARDYKERRLLKRLGLNPNGDKQWLEKLKAQLTVLSRKLKNSRFAENQRPNL